MIGKGVKCLLVAAFSLFSVFVFAQEADLKINIFLTKVNRKKKENTKKFDANEVIFGHVLDAHQFHFLDIYRQ